MEQSVLAGRAGDDDMVGKLEATLESARRDALIEDVALLILGAGFLRTANGQRVLARLDRELFSPKPATASVIR